MQKPPALRPSKSKSSVLDIVEGQIYERLTEGPVQYDRTFFPPVQDSQADRARSFQNLDLRADGRPVLNGENCTIT